MAVHRVHRWGVGVGVAGGSAAVAAVLGMGVAHADGTETAEINGWQVQFEPSTIQPDDPYDKASATLLDPSGSLGAGTTSIPGEWSSTSAVPFSSVGGSNDVFTMGLSAVGDPNFTSVSDVWEPGFLLSSIQGAGESTTAVLLPSLDGNQVVDLWQFSGPDAPPLLNPDATGPIDVGGVELASPDAGALFNDLFDGVFHGDSTALSNAATLFDDLFGIDPAGAADAVDAGGLVPDLGI